LNSTKNAIVICENWAAECRHTANWVWPPPRIACLGDNEVYHVVTPEITDPEMIESAIVARNHWQTGICSSCKNFPETNNVDENLLDELVTYINHIFVPAFDGSGYLIWTSNRKRGQNYQ